MMAEFLVFAGAAGATGAALLVVYGLVRVVVRTNRERVARERAEEDVRVQTQEGRIL